MPEATQPQPAESKETAYVEQPLVEKAISTEEVAPSSQDKDIESPDYGSLVQESKKYRARAQKSEQELSKLQKQIDADRQKQMEEQNEWQALAEERAVRIAELEPIVEKAKVEEAALREQILADFSEEDRETFGDLPLSKLRALHGKIIQNPSRVAIANNPAVPVNEVPEDWTEMSDKDRKQHWDKIVASYRRTP
jgi:hypothetical protein